MLRSFYSHHGIPLRADHRCLQLRPRPRQDALREQLLVADVGRLRHRDWSGLLLHGLGLHPRLLRKSLLPDRVPRIFCALPSNAG